MKKGMEDVTQEIHKMNKPGGGGGTGGGGAA